MIQISETHSDDDDDDRPRPTTTMTASPARPRRPARDRRRRPRDDDRPPGRPGAPDDDRPPSAPDDDRLRDWRARIWYHTPGQGIFRSSSSVFWSHKTQHVSRPISGLAPFMILKSPNHHLYHGRVIRGSFETRTVSRTRRTRVVTISITLT